MDNKLASMIVYDSKATPEIKEATVSIPMAVELPLNVHRQILTYIRATNIEVSGLGHAKYVDGVITIMDAFLPKQVGSPGGTELDQEDMAKMIISHSKNGDNRPLNFWWHSHVNMGTFWSGTDDANCERLVENAPWVVSIVGCQDGSLRARFDLRQPVRITLDLLPLTVLIPEINDKSTKKWMDEVTNKVATPPPISLPAYNPPPLQTWNKNGYGKWNKDLEEKKILPPPTRKRSLDSGIIDINKKDGWEVDWEHDPNCHVHDDGFACEHCMLSSCDDCRINNRYLNVGQY